MQTTLAKATILFCLASSDVSGQLANIIDFINFSHENFKTKEYLREMDMNKARINFKIRTEMLNFKFNYKSDPKNSACLWNCDSCQSAIETQDHILWCPSYSELREGKDLKNDKDVIDYFEKVLKIREKLKITI